MGQWRIKTLLQIKLNPYQGLKRHRALLTAILLVLAITSCSPPTEKPVSEQPQATEGTPEPARVQTPVQQEEPSPKQTPVQTPTPAASAGNCDRAYPDVCIAPPPPDLDCKDVPHQNFRVLPPDPHRFDGKDKDGIGCESR